MLAWYKAPLPSLVGGAPGYVAPEMLTAKHMAHPLMCGLWVLSHTLLKLPAAAMSRPCSSSGAEYEFDPTYWGDISEAAKAFSYMCVPARLIVPLPAR